MAKGAWIFGVDVVGKTGRPKGSAKVLHCGSADHNRNLWTVTGIQVQPNQLNVARFFALFWNSREPNSTNGCRKVD